jgi:hypothetical protein
LTRHLAEQRLAQRRGLTANLGLGIALVGQWIAFPSTWRAVLAILYVALLAALAPRIQWDTRHARRFLDNHRPEDPRSPA